MTYCSKLRSSARKENALPPLPTRQTPRYLRIIAAPDDEHQRRLEVVADSVAVLKWTVVEEYTDLTADIMRQQVWRTIRDHSFIGQDIGKRSLEYDNEYDR
jgi:hypothetical protein